MEGGLGEKLRELIEKASQEASKGVAWAMERVVVVGRKEDEGVVEVGGEKEGEDQVGVKEGGVERGEERADVIGGGNGKKRKRKVWLKVWKRLGFGSRG